MAEKGILGAGGNTVRVDSGEVQEAGDWAYEIGAFTASAPDSTVLNGGKYIVIWRRQQSGDGKFTETSSTETLGL
jgi:ketosteroid isomerase-like protein